MHMFVSAVALGITLCASTSYGQSPPPGPTLDPLAVALSEWAAESNNLLIGSPGLPTVEDAHLDVNTDGFLDADDIAAWFDGLVPEQVNEKQEILLYAYELVRDINRDGVVDALDVSLLKTRIAAKRLESGLLLTWRGGLINPTLTPIYFDGAHVISAPNGPSGFAQGQLPETLDESQYSGEIQPVDIGNGDGGGDDDCPIVVVSESSYPDLPISIVDGWQESRVCGEGPVVWQGHISIVPSTYGQDSVHLTCGIEQDKVFAISQQQTTESTISVQAGAKIDSYVSLGVAGRRRKRRRSR